MLNWLKKIFKKHKTPNHRKGCYKAQTPFQASFQSDEDRDKEIQELILLQDDICSKHHG